MKFKSFNTFAFTGSENRFFNDPFRSQRVNSPSIYSILCRVFSINIKIKGAKVSTFIMKAPYIRLKVDQGFYKINSQYLKSKVFVRVLASCSFIVLSISFLFWLKKKKEPLLPIDSDVFLIASAFNLALSDSQRQCSLIPSRQRKFKNILGASRVTSTLVNMFLNNRGLFIAFGEFVVVSIKFKLILCLNFFF